MLVRRGIVEHEVEQPRQRRAELGPFAVPRADQVRAVDGQIGEAMRALALLLDEPLERSEVLAPGYTRHVLSDWDCDAAPPRAQVLRLTRDGFTRIDWPEG